MANPITKPPEMSFITAKYMASLMVSFDLAPEPEFGVGDRYGTLVALIWIAIVLFVLLLALFSYLYLRYKRKKKMNQNIH